MRLRLGNGVNLPLWINFAATGSLGVDRGVTVLALAFDVRDPRLNLRRSTLCQDLRRALLQAQQTCLRPIMKIASNGPDTLAVNRTKAGIKITRAVVTLMRLSRFGIILTSILIFIAIRPLIPLATQHLTQIILKLDSRYREHRWVMLLFLEMLHFLYLVEDVLEKLQLLRVNVGLSQSY